MQKKYLNLLVFAFLSMNVKAQRIMFNENNIAVRSYQKLIETASCGNERWYYIEVQLVVKNNSGRPIIVDKIDAQFPSQIRSSGTNLGGPFHPCKTMWTGKGSDFVALFNQRIINNGSLSVPMYSWVTTQDFTHSFGFSYTPVKTASTSKPDAAQKEPVKKNNTITTTSSGTRYSVKNGELIILNGDLAEHILIAKMTPQEIKHYEELSGLSLTGGKTTSSTKPEQNLESKSQLTSENKKVNREEFDKLSDDLTAALMTVGTNPDAAMKDVNRIAKLMSKMVDADPDADPNMKKLSSLLIKISESSDDDVLLKNLEALLALLGEIDD